MDGRILQFCFDGQLIFFKYLRWADVECALSSNFYELNARIGVVPEADIPSFSEESVTGSKNVLFNNNPEVRKRYGFTVKTDI